MRRGVLVVCLAILGCAGNGDALGYRLANSGEDWADDGERTVVAELRERYPHFFEVILDPGDTRDPDVRPLRGDLEHAPVDRRNFDALNAIAVAYFELNYRAQLAQGGGFYLGNSFRAAHLLAIPWRAYAEVQDGALRDAILDFFEDAGSGEKLGTAATAPRLAGIIASLEPKEQNSERRARIEALASRFEALGRRDRERP